MRQYKGQIWKFADDLFQIAESFRMQMQIDRHLEFFGCGADGFESRGGAGTGVHHVVDQFSDPVDALAMHLFQFLAGFVRIPGVNMDARQIKIGKAVAEAECGTVEFPDSIPVRLFSKEQSSAALADSERAQFIDELLRRDRCSIGADVAAVCFQKWMNMGVYDFKILKLSSLEVVII